MEDILWVNVGGATMVDEPCEIALIQCINRKTIFIIFTRAILKGGNSLDLGLPTRYIMIVLSNRKKIFIILPFLCLFILQ